MIRPWGASEWETLRESSTVEPVECGGWKGAWFIVTLGVLAGVIIGVVAFVVL